MFPACFRAQTVSRTAVTPEATVARRKKDEDDSNYQPSSDDDRVSQKAKTPPTYISLDEDEDEDAQLDVPNSVAYRVMNQAYPNMVELVDKAELSRQAS